MKISIIGIGNMGSAILAGILSKGIVKSDDIIISDQSSEKLNEVSKKFNVKSYLDNMNIIDDRDIILIAVKPKDASSVLKDIQPNLKESQIIISVAAGVTIASMELILGEKIKIIRAMPNTPAIVGSGITAISPNLNIKIEDSAVVKNLFTSIGEVVELEEKHMDAVTGLSGSGPAYILTIIEALADGGVNMGLARDVAVKLAVHTTLGTAKLLLETGKHTAELRDQVTSPGGTTCFGLYAMEKGKVRATLIKAVKDATRRSKSLGS